MSTAAIGAGADPLAGVAGPLSAFRTQLGAAGASLRNALRDVGRARGAADGIRGGAASADPALRQLRTGADAAGKSVAKAGRTAGSRRPGSVPAAAGPVVVPLPSAPSPPAPRPSEAWPGSWARAPARSLG